MAMGRIVVTEFVTVDGVMEDPGGGETSDHGGWAFQFERGPDGDRYKLDELLDAEALLLGRVTYEGFSKAWPTLTDEIGFADKMNSMPKYVASTTLRDPQWNNTTVLSGDVVEEVRKLRQRADGNILVAGSATLVAALAEHDLVDEYRLMVYPVVLGTGKRLFRDGLAKTGLQLVEGKPVGDAGVVVLTYRKAQS
jgi:dihydrofolate reductase